MLKKSFLSLLLCVTRAIVHLNIPAKEKFFCLVIAGLESTRETAIVLSFPLLNSNCVLTALLLLVVT